ncbi:MAG: DUF4330 family protein [Caldisericia bacterium]|nr:DUF4330 family protein [Caldisericia bacterium]
MKSTWKWIDIIVVLSICLGVALLVLKGVQSAQYKASLQPVRIEIVVPNLDPDVADQIQIGDELVDKNAKPVFVIQEKSQKQAQHPVIDPEGNILVAEHPLMVSLFLWVESVEPMEYQNGIQYNWQVVKVGGSLIWETTTERFVGLVRQLKFESN